MKNIRKIPEQHEKNMKIDETDMELNENPKYFRVFCFHVFHGVSAYNGGFSASVRLCFHATIFHRYGCVS